MRAVILTVACLACVSHGRRVQTAREQTQGSSSEEPGSLKPLANLMAAEKPTAGFQGNAAGAVRGSTALGRSSKSPVMGPLRDAVMADGLYEETNFEFWDPLNFADQVSDEALMWFRAAEIKHGRVSMLATVGYALGAMGVTFPGLISPSTGLTFAAINKDGVAGAWDNTPTAGKLQIAAAALILELISEGQKPHYMRGGAVGVVPPFAGKGAWKGEADERQKKAEMKHGRIAMFGIISLLVSANIPGSVPGLTALGL